MRRAAFISLVVLSAIAVVVGVWFFRRDEYPFQFTQDQVVSARAESLESPGVVGTLASPTPELAAWIGSMERDTSDARSTPVTRLIVDLKGGRRLQLDVGPDVSLGRWVAGPQTGQSPIRLDTETSLYWYLRGVIDAMPGG